MEYPLAVPHASGPLTYLLCNAALYRNRQNDAAGLVLIAHDVSQQKQREDELARLHADMMVHAEELKQREAEIQRINDLYEVLQACNSEQEAYPIIGSVAADLFPRPVERWRSRSARPIRWKPSRNGEPDPAWPPPSCWTIAGLCAAGRCRK